MTYMAKQSIKDLNLAGKRVLMRVDFNVPQDKQTGEITNTQRITAALPTIQYALEHGASVVLMSHLGRPDGRKTPKYTLKPVAAKVEALVRRPVKFLDDCVGAEVKQPVPHSGRAESSCSKISAFTSRRRAK